MASTQVARLDALVAELHAELSQGPLPAHLDGVLERLAQFDQQHSAYATIISGTGQSLNAVRSTTFQVLGQISELGDMSDRIAAMVDVIRRIASQTNLLSLNATIEAARAGEAGRGFAVVAGEVRKLAQDARETTEAIDAIVTEIREVTDMTIEVANAASDQVEQTKNDFDQLVETIQSSAAEIRGMVDGANAAQKALGQLQDHIRNDAVGRTPGRTGA